MCHKEYLTCQRILSITVFLGFMIHHMLRVNISIAIIEMLVNNSTNSSLNPRYNWSEHEKNDILGYFFWGYVITQIPGGRLSEKFGFKIVVGLGLLSASLLTLLTPLAAQFGHIWLTAVRFCLGVSLGIHWPSTHPIVSKWIQTTKAAKFMSHMTASSLGVAITLPICGYLIEYFGWPSVFYVTGTIAIIWSLSWFYLIYNSPDEHPRISVREKEKLKSQLQITITKHKRPVPWMKILFSGPVWAIIVGNTCGGCTFFIAFNQLPTYLSKVLHFNVTENGWFSSLPYLMRYCVSVSAACLADQLKKKSVFSTTTIRKSFTATLFFGTAILFTIQAIFGFSRVVSIAVFTGSLGFIGLATPGIYINPLDIAPEYAGTIFGISQVPGALVGYFTTKFVAYATEEAQDFQHWTYVFWMLVTVNIFAGIFVAIFISGEEQEWSLDDKNVLHKFENNVAIT